MSQLIQDTAQNMGVTLILALSYGARWEILEAVKKIAVDYKSGKIDGLQQITEDVFSGYLTTATIPEPDLLIRTSGDGRL